MIDEAIDEAKIRKLLMYKRTLWKILRTNTRAYIKQQVTN